MTLAFASSVAYLAVAGTIRTDGATVAATLLLDAIRPTKDARRERRRLLFHISRIAQR